MNEYKITVTKEQLLQIQKAHSLIKICLGDYPKLDENFKTLYDFGNALIGMQNQALESNNLKEGE